MKNYVNLKDRDSAETYLHKAIETAKRSKLPTLIIVNTILGKYSAYENTNKKVITTVFVADDEKRQVIL